MVKRLKKQITLLDLVYGSKSHIRKKGRKSSPHLHLGAQFSRGEEGLFIANTMVTASYFLISSAG